VGQYPPEAVAAVGHVLHGVEQVSYRSDTGHEACAACDGWGLVRTGSRVAGNETITCANCRGFGYTPPPGESQNGHVVPDTFHAPAGEHPEPIAHGDRDSWGEPAKLPDGRANPNYGRMPDHKILVEPYGITAGLGAAA